MSVSEFSFFGVEFIKYYTVHVHGYLSVFVCAFGSIANVFNTTVFTRKHMNSPIITVLYFLALVDLIMLLVYLPEAWYLYLRPNSDPYEYWFDTYEWALFIYWQYHISHIFTNTSIWLTAFVLLWKYIAIAYPWKNRMWCTTRNIFKTVVLVFFSCLLLQVPASLTFTVFPITMDNFTAYELDFNDSTPVLRYLLNVDNFLYSIFFRLLPAVFITTISAKLLLAFSKMKKFSENLNAEANSNAAHTRNEKQITRTTLILIILSVVCLITQLPQSILGLTYYFFDKYEHSRYENLLKEFTIILELINSAISFVIYYASSKQFRETFKTLFNIKSIQEVSVRLRRNQTSSDNSMSSTV